MMVVNYSQILKRTVGYKEVAQRFAQCLSFVRAIHVCAAFSLKI